MKLNLIHSMIVITVFALSANAGHAKNLTETMQCADNSDSMASCRSFISGFLQGALLTDAAIIKSISTNESFLDRVKKTRLNKKYAPPTELAGFCLPAEKTMTQLTEKVLDNIKNVSPKPDKLAQHTYSFLKQSYPC